MKILVRLPTWIGDTIMATPLLEGLKNLYQGASFTLVGSMASIEILKRNFPQSRLFIDHSKKSGSRLWNLYRLAQEVGQHDIAITLQNNLLSALFLWMTRTPVRIGYTKECRSFLLTHSLKPLQHAHQVQRYTHLLSPLKNIEAGELFLAHSPKTPYFPQFKQVGINTGGAFGSAKRWSEKHFIQTVQTLLQEGYGVILLGSQEDIKTNLTISNMFQGEDRLLDLTGQTTLEELIDTIATLQLLITNDSGPMHIAAALKIPIVAIFGSTDATETSPWQAKASILSKNLPCSPCKKRSCPLKHHACMEDLHAEEVLEVARNYLT